MSAPLTTLRAKLHAEPHRYLLDDLADYLLSARGRENTALILLAVSCVAGIFLIGRYA